MTTQPRLIQEYMFIDVMSTFLRAIRAGAIHVRHGAILLAHHGRLGASFDMCAKVVIEVLREEGVMNDQADLVELVAIQAIQEVSALMGAIMIADLDCRRSHWSWMVLCRMKAMPSSWPSCWPRAL